MGSQLTPPVITVTVSQSGPTLDSIYAGLAGRITVLYSLKFVFIDVLFFQTLFTI